MAPTTNTTPVQQAYLWTGYWELHTTLVLSVTLEQPKQKKWTWHIAPLLVLTMFFVLDKNGKASQIHKSFFLYKNTRKITHIKQTIKCSRHQFHTSILTFESMTSIWPTSHMNSQASLSPLHFASCKIVLTIVHHPHFKKSTEKDRAWRGPFLPWV